MLPVKKIQNIGSTYIRHAVFFSDKGRITMCNGGTINPETFACGIAISCAALAVPTSWHLRPAPRPTYDPTGVRTSVLNKCDILNQNLIFYL